MVCTFISLLTTYIMADYAMRPPRQYPQCPNLLIISQFSRTGEGGRRESRSSCDGFLEIQIKIVTLAGEATLSRHEEKDLETISDNGLKNCGR